MKKIIKRIIANIVASIILVTVLYTNIMLLQYIVNSITDLLLK